HSSVDKETADQVCTAIEERGVNCWIAPRDMPPGATYGGAIIQALENCSAIVLIVSEHSNASPQVMNEIERAVSKRKEVFPLKVDAVTPSQELEYFIARHHWLDATTAPLDQLLDQMATAIQNTLSAEADAVSSGTSAAVPPRVQQPPRQASASAQTKRSGGKKGMSIAAGALVLVLIAAAVAYMTLRQPAAPELSELPAAYAALKQRDWSKAESLFQQLLGQSHPQAQGQGYAGLTAVASARDDDKQALLLATEAEKVDPDIVYSHVIRGNIMWKREELSEAERSYRTALDKSNGVSWQKAEAANRLGRIYAFQGQAKKAIDHYDKAIELDPTMAEVHTNKGHLQAQRELYQDAIALYQQALQVDPEDKVATVLLRVAEGQKAFKQDRDRFRRMQNRVRELMETFQIGKGNPTSEPAWVSMSLTLILLPLQRQGSLAVRAGEEEFLQYTIEQALRDSGRVTLISPELLKTLLAQWKMNESDLADPATAERVGRILQARQLASGHFTQRGDAGDLTLQLREIASGTTLKADVVQNTNNPLDAVVKQGTRVLLNKLRQTYPLQGHIGSVSSQGVVLNIGKEHGVTSGLLLEVLGSADSGDGNSADTQSMPVGRIRVDTVEAQQSKAAVLKQAQPFRKEWKVREVQQP
ncbi:MAG: toll/interleukin-1 receptor domain-containing protein, partial [Candidatus Tectomicrobia bacterium]|nr:toll/interleukin-1 receptor domain-containing protein [Candidatus Tectomicrobia bacterium]